jgi:photosystem I reaction center subunit XII|uniref:Photosystem I reaction center subunit XII n=1 Tax=Phaeocystis antarctica TaxID=33657 RepID=M9TEM7_9EUKA|nr:photosystem I reaction center subunit XII [Phaeocystis antarctica]AGJ03432.1 photosystem I reaction center subunit XII [Phaeocystis antarctica]
MITDAQIFLALGIALVAAVFAIGLGRQLYA